MIFGNKYMSLSLLLHCDGVNDSTNFVDSSPNGLSLTAFNGAKLTTAEKKFGTASGIFDRTSSNFVQTEGSSVLNLDPSDAFTIDFWFKRGDTSAAAQYLITRANPTSDTLSASLLSITIQLFSDNYIYAALYNGSNAQAVQSLATYTDIDWHHVQMCVLDEVIYFFIDGVLQGTNDTGYSTINGDDTWTMYLAGRQGGRYFDGYIDEVRVLKGEIAHTSDFTPPDSPYNGDTGYNENIFSLIGRNARKLTNPLVR